MDDYYINLNEIGTLKNNFEINKQKYKNKNKEYYHLNYDDKTLFVNFKGTIYDFKIAPRKKIFIKVDDVDYNNYLDLISVISLKIGINIQEYDSTYVGDGHYLLGFINGFKNDEDNIIYTNFKHIKNNNKLEEINIINDKLFYENKYIESFEGIITLRIKTICKDTFKEITYKLFNDIHQIVIIKEIIKKNNNENLIFKLINNI